MLRLASCGIKGRRTLLGTLSISQPMADLSANASTSTPQLATGPLATDIQGFLGPFLVFMCIAMMCVLYFESLTVFH